MSSELTLGQKAILELLRDGLNTQEIAEALRLSANTIKLHRVTICVKLRARNTVHAVVIAARRGFISLDRVVGMKPSRMRPAKVKAPRRDTPKMEFCRVCGHSIYDFSKHVQTEEHRRNVRRLSDASKDTKPRLPMEVR